MPPSVPSRLSAAALAVSAAFAHAQPAEENASLPDLAGSSQSGSPAPIRFRPGTDSIGLDGGSNDHRFSLHITPFIGW